MFLGCFISQIWVVMYEHWNSRTNNISFGTHSVSIVFFVKYSVGMSCNQEIIRIQTASLAPVLNIIPLLYRDEIQEYQLTFSYKRI